jgi:hypothetical protein
MSSDTVVLPVAVTTGAIAVQFVQWYCVHNLFKNFKSENERHKQAFSKCQHITAHAFSQKNFVSGSVYSTLMVVKTSSKRKVCLIDVLCISRWSSNRIPTLIPLSLSLSLCPPLSFTHQIFCYECWFERESAGNTAVTCNGYWHKSADFSSMTVIFITHSTKRYAHKIISITWYTSNQIISQFRGYSGYIISKPFNHDIG